ncbi:hypothetical protein B0H14DRAFT_3472454 [Mycena olivaceomarginata]|nr:hypothetical protein B0H14DRAFT_3472454 [Mycena olivaceomarginata]
MDGLIPSAHNNVTIACLELYLKLMVEPHPKHTNSVSPLTREGNYMQVRIPAFDGLFMNYVLAVILALLVWIGEMKLNSKDPESSLIEEASSIPDKNKESRKSEIDTMIKYTRSMPARSLHVEFAPESGIAVHVVGEEAGQRLMNMFDSDGVWLPFKVDGAAGEAVVGVDVVHDDVIKAVKPLPSSPSSSSAGIAGDAHTHRHQRPKQR